MSDTLSDSEREKAFPIHIDLGKRDSGGPVDSAAPIGKKTKARTYYPTLYIDNVPGLEQLPKEGCILVEFRRKRLSIEENGDGDETAGVTLEIRALCLPEDMGDSGDDLSSAMEKFMKGSAGDTNDSDSGAQETDDEDDEG